MASTHFSHLLLHVVSHHQVNSCLQPSLASLRTVQHSHMRILNNAGDDVIKVKVKVFLENVTCAAFQVRLVFFCDRLLHELACNNKQVRDVTRSRTNCRLNSPIANSCSLCFMSDIEPKLMSACTKPATRSTREPSCTLTALYSQDETCKKHR